MSLLAPLVFVLPVLSGAMLAHLLWPDRTPYGLLFKAFLGIGVGLGLRSLLYFAYLLLFAGSHWFIALEAALFLFLLILASRRERGSIERARQVDRLHVSKGWRRALLASAMAIAFISLLTTANYLLRRRQGDWDAWMMYNRAARFIFLDQAHWLQSFSPQMDPLFHADYPLLLALNIASGWQTLGREAAGVPMIQSALFAAGCAGLLISCLGKLKSGGQAALGLIIMWGIPAIVNEGARQMADIPLALYVLATGSVLFMYVEDRHPALLALGGLTAGLAAWAKNEGAVLVAGAGLAVLVVGGRRDLWRRFITYLSGAALPLAVLLYFRIFIAPSGDIMSGGAVRFTQQASDISRHMKILQHFGQTTMRFGSWEFVPIAVGIIPILFLYYLLFRAPVPSQARPAYVAVAIILAVQLVGYYAAFLVTPYDLAWHLSYSTERLVVQVFPLFLLMILCAGVPAETVLEPNVPRTNGVQHASDD